MTCPCAFIERSRAFWEATVRFWERHAEIHASDLGRVIEARVEAAFARRELAALG